MSAPDVLVKICGLMRPEDTHTAEAAGADFVGVVLSGGFSRSVPLERAEGIVGETSLTRVAVLVDEPPEASERAAHALGAQVLQLHGEEGPDLMQELRRRGAWRLWKAVRARTADDVRAAVERYGAVADGIVVEGWREGVTGGGGARLQLAPEEVSDVLPPGRDFILAGGLRADSVREAVTRFGPTVVDVSSGVESAVGEKDPELVRAFVAAARAGAPAGRGPRR